MSKTHLTPQMISHTDITPLAKFVSSSPSRPATLPLRSSLPGDSPSFAKSSRADKISLSSPLRTISPSHLHLRLHGVRMRTWFIALTRPAFLRTLITLLPRIFGLRLSTLLRPLTSLLTSHSFSRRACPSRLLPLIWRLPTQLNCSSFSTRLATTMELAELTCP